MGFSPSAVRCAHSQCGDGAYRVGWGVDRHRCGDGVAVRRLVPVDRRPWPRCARTPSRRRHSHSSAHHSGGRPTRRIPLVTVTIDAIPSHASPHRAALPPDSEGLLGFLASVRICTVRCHPVEPDHPRYRRNRWPLTVVLPDLEGLPRVERVADFHRVAGVGNRIALGGRPNGRSAAPCSGLFRSSSGTAGSASPTTRTTGPHPS